MAFLALAVPGSALAGTYTWDLATNFTATPPGANPDHDAYGATPWSYETSSGTSLSPSTFSLLSTFASGGGLSAWTTTNTGDGAVVGLNTTGAPITVGKMIFPAGQMFVEPGSGGQVVAVGWTSPFTQPEKISIDGTVSSDIAKSCTNYGIAWTVDQNGTALQKGTIGKAGGSAPFSPTATVAPGGSVYITVSNTGDATCDGTGLSLQIEAPGAAPAPTLTTPTSGSTTTVTKPVFSGAASAQFGDSSQVIVRIYSGSAASGTPVQTLAVPRSGTAWAAALGAPLPLGTYTAQAEQDDVASPADVALTSPVTFVIRAPVIALGSLGSTPLTTSTPTLTGTGDTDAGSQAFAIVDIFSGDTAAGSPALSLTTPVASNGQFSVQVPSSLADGTYTAVAEQGSTSATVGSSAPQTFSIDTQPPVVTLLTPATGSRADSLQLVFTGAAGTASFDSRLVTVTLYKGSQATGKPYGTMQARVTGSTWSGTWPRMLAPGQYTVVAAQSDAVGHVGMTAPRAFLVTPLPPVIGSTATINRAGRASVKITCNEPAGNNCSGTVLVLTRRKFQPRADGPIGRLTVMFAYVHIPGGKTQTISRKVLAAVAGVLRHHANVAVTISANLRPRNGAAIRATVRGNLRHIG